MALTKVTYVDGQTIIGAANLNAIQDEIIANGNAIGTQATAIQNLGTNKADVTALNAEASARAEADTAIKSAIDDMERIAVTTAKMSDLELYNGYVRYSDGYVPSASDINWKHTDYLGVSQGDTITAKLTGAGTTVAVIAAYNSSKTYVQANSVNTANFDSTYTVPSGVAFVRISTLAGHEGETLVGTFTITKTVADQFTDVRNDIANTNADLVSLQEGYMPNIGVSYSNLNALSSHNGQTYRVLILNKLIYPVSSVSMKIYMYAATDFHVYAFDTQWNCIYRKTFSSLSTGTNILDLSDLAPTVPYYIGFDNSPNQIYTGTTGSTLNYLVTNGAGLSDYVDEGDNVKLIIYGASSNMAVSCELNIAYIDYDLIQYFNNKGGLMGKTIFLAGDSRSSTDYNFYGTTLTAKTKATILVKGASGKNVAYLASAAYLATLTNNPHDFSIWLVGGNDTGASGTVGTFDATSPNGQDGETVVSEIPISGDYNGTTFVQAVDYIMRWYINAFYDFKTLNNGHKPRMIFCTDIPQKREDPAAYSDPENWERKRQAIIECCEKNNVACLDLLKECHFNMSYEPTFPANTPTDKEHDNGLYYMDGVHPNQFGIDLITSLEVQEMLKYVWINPYRDYT